MLPLLLFLLPLSTHPLPTEPTSHLPFYLIANKDVFIEFYSPEASKRFHLVAQEPEHFTMPFRTAHTHFNYTLFYQNSPQDSLEFDLRLGSHSRSFQFHEFFVVAHWQYPCEGAQEDEVCERMYREETERKQKKSTSSESPIQETHEKKEEETKIKMPELEEPSTPFITSERILFLIAYIVSLYLLKRAYSLLTAEVDLDKHMADAMELAKDPQRQKALNRHRDVYIDPYIAHPELMHRKPPVFVILELERQRREHEEREREKRSKRNVKHSSFFF